MSIFHLPDLGEGLADATVVRWHVQAGDEIRAEQLLVSVETDKAIVDIPSPQTGRIDALLAREGEVVPTHAALVRFADAEPTSTDAGSVVGSLPQHDVQMPSTDFLIGRQRHTEARMQQSQQRRAARAVVRGGHEVRIDVGQIVDAQGDARALGEGVLDRVHQLVAAEIHGLRAAVEQLQPL